MTRPLNGQFLTQEDIYPSLRLAGYEPAVPKKKKSGARRAKPEDVLHVAVRKFLDFAIAPPGVLSRDRVVWFSLESRNSGVTRRNKKTGATYNAEGQARKARGCVAGVPDIHFEWPAGAGWIELKAGKSDTSDRQDALHKALAGAGSRVGVARSLDDVERLLESWGVPVRARVSA